MVWGRLELVFLKESDNIPMLKDGTCPRFISPQGPIRTINVKHPAGFLDIAEQIASANEELLKKSGINAVQISDYNPDTFYVKDEKGYSVRAYQFYVYKK